MGWQAAALLLLSLSFVWQGCEAAVPFARPAGECATANASVNYFPTAFQAAGITAPSNQTVNVTTAQDFTVTYYNNYKVVKNLKANETYVLYQCGVPVPTVGAPGVPPGAKFFAVPLTNVVVAETTPLAFLAELNVTDRIHSVSSFAVGACAQKLLSCNRTAPDVFMASAPALRAALTQSGADAILMSGASNLTNSISFDATSDPGVLNRAEWVKFLGLFFNKDNMTSYDAINSSYKSFLAAANSPGLSSGYQPIVAFVQKFSYGGNNSYQISFAPYKLQYVEGAGALFLNQSSVLDLPGAVQVDNNTISFAWGPGQPFKSQQEAATSFSQVLQMADVVIDETYAPNPSNYTYPTFLRNFLINDTSYAFVDNNDVYRVDKTVGPAPDYGLDWFETAVARPDLVLGDFISVVSGNASARGLTAPALGTPGLPTRRWLRNIAKGEPVTVVLSTQCPAVTQCQQPVPLTPICAFVKTCGDGSVVEQQASNGTCQYAACS